MIVGTGGEKREGSGKGGKWEGGESGRPLCGREGERNGKGGEEKEREARWLRGRERKRSSQEGWRGGRD